MLLVFAGDNSDKLCKLCVGKIPGEWCSSADPYFGFEGAFRCLVEAGDIAFLKHSTVDEMTSSRFDFSENLLFYALHTVFVTLLIDDCESLCLFHRVFSSSKLFQLVTYDTRVGYIFLAHRLL